MSKDEIFKVMVKMTIGWLITKNVLISEMPEHAIFSDINL